MSRFLPDRFTMLLVMAVTLASVFPISGRYADWFGIATNCAIGLLFFLYGARLSREVVVGGLLHWRLHLAIMLVTFLLYPLIGLAIGFIPESILPQPFYMGILFLCVLPSTVQSSIAFTSMAGGNVPAAIVAASASNLIGIFLTPALVALLMSAKAGGGVSADALQQIATQLLLPFVAGQILQPWIGEWVRSKKKLLTPVDRSSILMVVYLAFSHAVLEGIWSSFSLKDIGFLILIDMALLATVLCVTRYGSRALGFSRNDEIAITFCGSKKSLASGVPMANAIFAGSPSIGAIVLPVMLFHQLELMTCAVIAQKYAARRKANEEMKSQTAPA